MTEQEKFEKWATNGDDDFDITINPAPNYDASYYDIDYTEAAWIAWQACAAEKNKEIAKMEAIIADSIKLMVDYRSTIAELQDIGEPVAITNYTH